MSQEERKEREEVNDVNGAENAETPRALDEASLNSLLQLNSLFDSYLNALDSSNNGASAPALTGTSTTSTSSLFSGSPSQQQQQQSNPTAPSSLGVARLPAQPNQNAPPALSNQVLLSLLGSNFGNIQQASLSHNIMRQNEAAASPIMPAQPPAAAMSNNEALLQQILLRLATAPSVPVQRQPPMQTPQATLPNPQEILNMIAASSLMQPPPPPPVQPPPVQPLRAVAPAASPPTRAPPPPPPRQSADAFPRKLFDLLHDSTVEDVISFNLTGTAFGIHQPDAFAERILPRYFGHHHMASFKRGLNQYRFQRITNGPDKGYFTHPLFRREQPALCAKIRKVLRRDQGGSGGR